MQLLVVQACTMHMRTSFLFAVQQASGLVKLSGVVVLRDVSVCGQRKATSSVDQARGLVS